MGQAAMTAGQADDDDDRSFRKYSRSMNYNQEYRDFDDLKLINLNLAFATPDQHAGEWFNASDSDRRDKGIPKWIPVQDGLQQQHAQINLVNQRIFENTQPTKIPKNDRSDSSRGLKDEKTSAQMLIPNLFDADSFSRFVTNVESPISVENYHESTVDPNSSELDCRTVYYDNMGSSSFLLDSEALTESSSNMATTRASSTKNNCVNDPNYPNVIHVSTSQIKGDELSEKLSTLIQNDGTEYLTNRKSTDGSNAMNFRLELCENNSDRNIHHTIDLNSVQDSTSSLVCKTESELLSAENATTSLQVENTRLREEIARLKKLVVEKNEQISKFQHRKDGRDASEANEIEFLRETVKKLEGVKKELSRKVDKSEEKCKKYEIIFESMEEAVTNAEEKLKTIVEELRLEMIKTRDLEAKLMNAVSSWYDVAKGSANASSVMQDSNDVKQGSISG